MFSYHLEFQKLVELPRACQFQMDFFHLLEEIGLSLKNRCFPSVMWLNLCHLWRMGRFEEWATLCPTERWSSDSEAGPSRAIPSSVTSEEKWSRKTQDLLPSPFSRSRNLDPGKTLSWLHSCLVSNHLYKTDSHTIAGNRISVTLVRTDWVLWAPNHGTFSWMKSP